MSCGPSCDTSSPFCVAWALNTVSCWAGNVLVSLPPPHKLQLFAKAVSTALTFPSWSVETGWAVVVGSGSCPDGAHSAAPWPVWPWRKLAFVSSLWATPAPTALPVPKVSSLSQLPVVGGRVPWERRKLGDCVRATGMSWPLLRYRFSGWVL